jgi:RNA polymerase sigma-70 factor (ECF subfamily)
MERAQGGDRRAYAALLTEVATLVRGFVRSRLQAHDAIEDIVQETLLSIHRDRHSYDPARPFGPWMYAIARHRMLDFVAKQRRNRERETSWQRVAPAPAATEHADALHAALSLLTKAQREIVRMLKLEGYSVAEISAKTGLSQAAVRTTAYRGYRSLYKLLTIAADDE